MGLGVEKYTGKILGRYVKKRGEVIFAENGKYFLSKRCEKLSDASAIERVSNYGVARVLWVGRSEILQQFVDFDLVPLNLKEMAGLMGRIHSNKQDGLTLVHGDFSNSNTTRHNGDAKCFDYEHSHWGNPYVDIGRMVLRNCVSEKDVDLLFESYYGGMPPLEEMRDGFIAFCQRQYDMRHLKNLAFQVVPKVRAKRLRGCGSTLCEILHAFKDPVTP